MAKQVLAAGRMSLLPSKPDTSAAEEAEPRVVGVESDDADDLLAALSSDTAREVLSKLHDDPAPPAELADRVDTSLQNVQYHLENLEGAGAVEVVDTVYSEKGREMDVYAPADRPLIIFAGDEESTSSIRTALSRLLGGLGILGLASVAVQELVGGTARELLPGAGSPGDDRSAVGGDDGNGGDGADGADGADEADVTGGDGDDTGDGDAGAGGADGDAADAGDATDAASDTATARADTPARTEEMDTATATPTGDDVGVAEVSTTPAPEATVTPAPSATSAPVHEQTQTPEATPASKPTATPTSEPTATPASEPTATPAPEPGAAEPTAAGSEAVETATDVATEAATTAAQGGVETAAAGLPPGLAFFLGGATVLLGGFVVWYLRE